MDHRILLFLVGVVMLLPGAVAPAASQNVSEYPLRVHVYTRMQHEHHYKGLLDRVNGAGKANLFENTVPRGFDFQYECGAPLAVSSGYRTYPAKWKTREKILEILVPEAGKTGSYESCTLDVTMKDSVYFKRKGALLTETAEAYQKWMTQYNYDPEHGKNAPGMPAAKAQTLPVGTPASQSKAATTAGQQPPGNGK